MEVKDDFFQRDSFVVGDDIELVSRRIFGWVIPPWPIN
jgi:hypothetical protein